MGLATGFCREFYPLDQPLDCGRAISFTTLAAIHRTSFAPTPRILENSRAPAGTHDETVLAPGKQSSCPGDFAK